MCQASFKNALHPGGNNGQDPVEQGRCDEHFQEFTILAGKTVRTVGHLPDAHHRDLCRILLHCAELVADIRDNHSHGLRQDNPAHKLPACHPNRLSRLALSMTDGLDARPEDLGHVGAVVEAQG